MSRTSSYFWTDLQESILKSAYEQGGLPQAVQAIQAISDKKRSTIAAKACRMQITNPKPRKNRPDSGLGYP